MCGRYELDIDVATFKKRYAAQIEAGNGQLTYINASPTQRLPIIMGIPTRLQHARWGLLPIKPNSPPLTMFNARGETAAVTSNYMGLIADKRCIVPFTAFYEWKDKVSCKISLAETDQGAFAGLWDVRQGQLCYTTVTTPPNQDAAKAHDRMPRILSRAEQKIWLAGDTRRVEVLEIMQTISEASLNVEVGVNPKR